jgi:hypothetical protein
MSQNVDIVLGVVAYEYFVESSYYDDSAKYNLFIIIRGHYIEIIDFRG